MKNENTFARLINLLAGVALLVGISVEVLTGDHQNYSSWYFSKDRSKMRKNEGKILEKGRRKVKYYKFTHPVLIERKIYKTYGLIVIFNHKPVRIIFDISTDRKAMIKFVKDLNESDIDSNQLDDVIEDFIEELYIP